MSDSIIVGAPMNTLASTPAPAPVVEGVATGDSSQPAASTPPSATPAPSKTLELGKRPDRPSWLPDEYKSPEDFRRAFDEQKAKASGKDEAKLVSEQDLQGYMQEVVGTGALSDGSRRSLRAKGFTDALIDQHVAGLQAIRENQMGKTFSAAGGAENYAKMAEWAGTGLTETEQRNYNVAVNSGNPAIVEMAVAGLKARYDLANGGGAAERKPAPTRLSGGAPSGSTGIQMFNSMAEQVKATMDPRYQTDANYRNAVEKIIDASIRAGKY